MDCKIIVLCPVKNEDWILELFLKATSLFADLIIVADQFSTDNTVKIAQSFEKVIVIPNDRQEYDEDYRQRLLIAESRKHFTSSKKLLIALDADEIIAACSLRTTEWEKIASLPVGTVVKFKKPEVLFHEKMCIQSESLFPLGFVDDGSEHVGKKIHSVRVPYRADSEVYVSQEIIFMHMALSRLEEYKARQNLYSMVEKINRTKGIVQRLNYYSPSLQFLLNSKHKTDLPDHWYDLYQKLGVHLSSIKSSVYNQYNFQIVDLLLLHGMQRFRFEDIWATDYKSVWLNHPKYNAHTAVSALGGPGGIDRMVTKILITYAKIYYRVKQRVWPLLREKVFKRKSTNS